MTGVLRDEASALNEHWTTAITRGRPWLRAKWASSLDGRVAAADGSSRWITGAEARSDVHRRRSGHGAVVVSTGTALIDDPALTARDAAGELLPHQPLPFVVGSRDLPSTAALHRHPRSLVQVRQHDPYDLIEALTGSGVTSALVEGGPALLSAHLAAGTIDELLIYLAPTLLGGPHLALSDIGVPTIAGQLRLRVQRLLPLGEDVLLIARPSEDRRD